MTLPRTPFGIKSELRWRKQKMYFLSLLKASSHVSRASGLNASIPGLITGIYLSSIKRPQCSVIERSRVKCCSASDPTSIINSYSSTSELRYVGGCIRKVINNENFDDIDLATNIDPTEVCSALKKSNVEFYESGIDHGTITAIIGDSKFEITSLREDILTDGRHAKVKFSKDWKTDASRRDFTINSIYSDKEGNLFVPYNGYEDIKKG